MTVTYNHVPVIPRTGLQADLAGATAVQGEMLWTSDGHRLYVETGGVKYLVGEADFAKRPGSSTAGNLAGLDGDGNLTDSGSKPDDFAATSHGHAISEVTSLQTTLDGKLAKSGGTMTGALTLSGAPSTDLHAATKAYVDDNAGGGSYPKYHKHGLKVRVTGAATADVYAKELVVSDDSGNATLLSDVHVTGDMATSGAGGLETVGSELMSNYSSEGAQARFTSLGGVGYSMTRNTLAAEGGFLFVHCMHQWQPRNHKRDIL